MCHKLRTIKYVVKYNIDFEFTEVSTTQMFRSEGKNENLQTPPTQGYDMQQSNKVNDDIPKTTPFTLPASITKPCHYIWQAPKPSTSKGI
jgi:hypothetical protein